jgi:acetyl-CoA acetyltransferase
MFSHPFRDRCAIVGIGHTKYYPRGMSVSETNSLGLTCQAILAACEDAGLDVRDIDGFSSYADTSDGGQIALALGIPEVHFSNLVFGGGGGGSVAAVGNAVSAIVSGQASVVVVYHSIQQPPTARFGQSFLRPDRVLGNPALDFAAPFGLGSPGQMFALIARRYMHKYGATIDDFGAVAVTTRWHASHNPLALKRTPITLEDHHNSRLISDPLRLLDFCLENDGGGALIVVAAERARDFKQPPVYITAVSQGGDGRWGPAITTHNMPDELYTTAGHGAIARTLYERAGLGPNDVDVAELYDHFTPMVLMQLEDYGFCGRGEAGAFVREGRTRWPDGDLPVNTHGGNLSEVYLHGMTHIIEAVRQLRGTASCQVKDAAVALVTGGPSPVPSSAMILRRG